MAATIDTAVIVNDLQSAGQNIGQITVHEAPSAAGIVIYLPQIHQNPGSNLSDNSNDSAVIAQEQIYNVIKYLNQHDGVNFAMVEGDLYGPVPTDKISRLKTEIAGEQTLKNSRSTIAAATNIDQGAKSRVLANIDQTITKIDRAVTLQGGAYHLKAENDSLALYGAENEATYNESANVVRDYIYLQDRLSQISQSTATALANSSLFGKTFLYPPSFYAPRAYTSSPYVSSLRLPSIINQPTTQPVGVPSGVNIGVNNGMPTATSNQANILNYLLQRAGQQTVITQPTPVQSVPAVPTTVTTIVNNPTDIVSNTANTIVSNGGSDLDLLISQADASSQTDVAQACRNTEQVLADLSSIDQAATANAASAPSRANNPYASVTNPLILQAKLKADEAKIQSLIIDQRNQETAANMAHGLATENQKVGILQFGAGHEDGLVPELNKQNLSVIVVTVPEVQSSN